MKKHFAYHLMLLWLAALPALGADIRYPGKIFKENVTVPAGKPVTDLYVAGHSVTVEATVMGDLCAACGQADILGPIQRDLEVAVGTIDVRNSVGASVRLAAWKADLNSTINGDLVVLAHDLYLSDRAIVRGDAAIAAKDIRLDGVFKGRIFAAGDDIELNGPVAGDVVIRYERSLTLGLKCRLSGKLDCYGPQAPVITGGAVVPGLNYHPSRSFSSMLSRWTAVFGLPALLGLLAWLFAAGVVAKVCPKILKSSLDLSRQYFWKNSVVGLVVFLGTLLLLPLLLLTIIGSYAALLGLTLFITLALLARLFAVFILADCLKLFFEKSRDVQLPFIWVAAAVLLIHLTGMVPWFSWAFVALLSLSAFGALIQWLNKAK